MGENAAALGDGGVDKVSAYRHRRLDAEDQHQDGRHQGAAADAGQTDDEADSETGNCESEVHRSGTVKTNCYAIKQ